LVFLAVAVTCVLEAAAKLLDFVTEASKVQDVCALKAELAADLFVQLHHRHFAALEVTVSVELVHLTTTAE
jgi:hypothetical protein